MSTQPYPASLSFTQILNLFRRLPLKQKIKIARELEKDVVDSKLSLLLQTFKTDELSLDVLDSEVNEVRQQLYEKKQNKEKGHH